MSFYIKKTSSKEEIKNFFLEINEKEIEDITKECDQLYKLVYEAIAVNEDLDYLSSFLRLADLYGRYRRYEKAFEVLETAYIFSCKLLGKENPDTLSTLDRLVDAIDKLALTYSEKGDYEKEHKLETRYEELFANKFYYGSIEDVDLNKFLDRYETIDNAIDNIEKNADKYLGLQQYKNALPLFELCCHISYLAHGDKDARTLKILHRLAYCHAKRSDFVKAIELYEKCYGLRRETLGEKHQDTLLTLCELAKTHSSLDENKNAKELLKKCYAAQIEIGREGDALKTLKELALTYGALGNNDKKCEMLEICYEGMQRVFGERDFETVEVLKKLRDAYNGIDEKNTTN